MGGSGNLARQNFTQEVLENTKTLRYRAGVRKGAWGFFKMRFLLAISALFLIAGVVVAPPVSSQTYNPDTGENRVKDDYSDLLRRASGVEPKPRPAPQPREEARNERRSLQSPDQAVAVKPKPAKVEDAGEYLNSASDYANEPHKVRIVDRSKFNSDFLPADLPNTLNLAPGDILIDTKARQLYFAKSASVVRRYGVSVGKEGAAWKGEAVIGRTARWPDWHPTANQRKENPKLKAKVVGGADNPLGARALYLYQNGKDTLYRIHGTNAPSSIGKFASSGCIRMINEDVIELYSMVRKGAKVFVR